MKNIIFASAVIFSMSIMMNSFSSNEITKIEIKKSERIRFSIKGTGSKNIFVTIGVGIRPGSGSCCSGVAHSSTVGFSGMEGEVVYDGKTKRLLFTITKSISGKVIDLKDFY